MSVDLELDTSEEGGRKWQPPPKSFAGSTMEGGDTWQEYERQTTAIVESMLQTMDDRLYADSAVPRQESPPSAKRNRYALEHRHNFETHNKPQVSHTQPQYKEWTHRFMYLRIRGRHLGGSSGDGEPSPHVARGESADGFSRMGSRMSTRSRASSGGRDSPFEDLQASWDAGSRRSSVGMRSPATTLSTPGRKPQQESFGNAAASTLTASSPTWRRRSNAAELLIRGAKLQPVPSPGGPEAVEVFCAHGEEEQIIDLDGHARLPRDVLTLSDIYGTHEFSLLHEDAPVTPSVPVSAVPVSSAAPVTISTPRAASWNVSVPNLFQVAAGAVDTKPADPILTMPVLEPQRCAYEQVIDVLLDNLWSRLIPQFRPAFLVIGAGVVQQILAVGSHDSRRNTTSRPTTQEVLDETDAYLNEEEQQLDLADEPPAPNGRRLGQIRELSIVDLNRQLRPPHFQESSEDDFQGDDYGGGTSESDRGRISPPSVNRSPRLVPSYVPRRIPRGGSIRRPAGRPLVEDSGPRAGGKHVTVVDADGTEPAPTRMVGAPRSILRGRATQKKDDTSLVMVLGSQTSMVAATIAQADTVMPMVQGFGIGGRQVQIASVSELPIDESDSETQVDVDSAAAPFDWALGAQDDDSDADEALMVQGDPSPYVRTGHSSSGKSTGQSTTSVSAIRPTTASGQNSNAFPDRSRGRVRGGGIASDGTPRNRTHRLSVVDANGRLDRAALGSSIMRNGAIPMSGTNRPATAAAPSSSRSGFRDASSNSPDLLVSGTVEPSTPRSMLRSLSPLRGPGGSNIGAIGNVPHGIDSSRHTGSAIMKAGSYISLSKQGVGGALPARTHQPDDGEGGELGDFSTPIQRMSGRVSPVHTDARQTGKNLSFWTGTLSHADAVAEVLAVGAVGHKSSMYEWCLVCGSVLYAQIDRHPRPSATATFGTKAENDNNSHIQMSRTGGLGARRRPTGSSWAMRP